MGTAGMTADTCAGGHERGSRGTGSGGIIRWLMWLVSGHTTEQVEAPGRDDGSAPRHHERALTQRNGASPRRRGPAAPALRGAVR